jgi:bacterioferritin (cytochrome b1)
MPAKAPIDILNRVLVILRKSFPQYARYSRPYIPPGHERAWRTLRDIAITEESLAHQVSDEILAEGGLIAAADFPIEFTDTHDLGIDYMIAEAVGYQRQDIKELEECVEALAKVATPHAVVEEILAVSKRHLKSLEELHANPGSSTSFGTNVAASNDAPASAAT